MNNVVRVKLKSFGAIEKAHGLDKDGRVTRFLRDTVDRYCDEYVPMNNAELKTNKRYPTNNTITYVSPYAHYIYYGKLMLAPNGSCWAKEGEKKHYVGKKLKYQGAPKRGPRWEKRMMNDRRRDVERDLQNFIDNGG